jgi:hypothetical protein
MNANISKSPATAVASENVTFKKIKNPYRIIEVILFANLTAK